MKKTSALLIAAVLLPALRPALVTAEEWTGNGTSLNWSDAGNWDTLPTPSSFLYLSDVFYPSAYTNAVGAVNNVVDVNYVAGGIVFNAQSAALTNHSYTTLIPSGITLTLGGSGPSYPALAVGDLPGSQWLSAGSFTNYSTITGEGSLLVNDTASLISVGQRNRATLDLTGLNTFTATAKQLLVGASSDNPNNAVITGALLLARTNTITTAANLSAPGVILGSFGLANNNIGIMVLGGTNVINTDGLVVGGRRANNTLLAFGSSYSNTPTAGNLLLRGSAGGNSRVGIFSIADMAAQPADYQGSPSFSSTAAADFSGGDVDIRADKIYVGRSAPDTGASVNFINAFGALTLERGTVDANNLYIAYKQGTNNSSAVGPGGALPVYCFVTLRSNVQMTVNQDVTMAFRNNGTNGSQIPNSALFVNDSSTLNIGGNLTTPTNGISMLQLGGGTVNMTANGNITNMTLAGRGTISGANTIMVVSNLMIGTAFGAGSLDLGGDLVLGTAFPLTFDLGATNTTGAGINDYLNVTGDVNLNNNPVSFTYGGPLLAGSNYTVITYTGNKTGSLIYSNDTRSQLGLDQSTTGQVSLVVTNWTPASLTWQGTTATNANFWSAGSNLNWTNNVTGAPDRFYQGDAVVFNDTAVTNIIYLDGVLMPASITVDSTKDIIFTNRSSAPISRGVIAGGGGITKNGTGAIAMGGYSNSFTGPINVNNGVWKLRDVNANNPNHMPTLGSPSGTMYVNNGATLDFNGTSQTATGKRLVIAGNGFNGRGVLTNGLTTQAQDGFALTLGGDSLVSAETGPFGLRSAVPSDTPPPFSGYMNLNGYTLTKVGSRRFSLLDVVATNAGSINVAAGYLATINSLIGGSGFINLSNNTYLFFGNDQNTIPSVAGSVDKALNVYNAALATLTTPATAVVNSTVNLLGTLSITNLQPLSMNGVISGNFGVTKYGTSNLIFNAVNTYSGPTLITAGSLALGAGGSIDNSPLITVAPGAALDVTAKPPGTFALASGQTLNMNGTVIGNLTVAANSTLLGSGIFNGSLTVNSGAEVALANTNVPGTTIVSNNLTLAGGHFTWELAPSAELGDGLVVNGNLNLSGVNTFTVNSIGGFDPSGTNTLITYSGTLSGGLANLAVNTSARFVVEFVDPATTPGTIQIRLVTPSPTLTWKGGSSSNPLNWDIKATTNWDNAGSPDVFWQSDVVRFDDLANTNLVNLVGTLGPASIAMENSVVAFTFGGAGGLVAASLVNGSGNLTITNASNNFFTGQGLILNGGNLTFAQPVNSQLTANLSGDGTFNKGAGSTLTLLGNSAGFAGQFNINGGTLRAGTSNVLGNGPAVVNNGATLDINGHFMNSHSSLSISGSGADGFGAINNRGGGRTNAISAVTLGGDTTLGAISNAWGMNGTLTGGGYALTKTNANDVWIQTGSDTGLGDIDIRQGRLVFGRSGTTLGQPEKSVLIRSAGTLALAVTNQSPSSGLPGIAAGYKSVTMQSGATFENVGLGTTLGANSFDGPISTVTNASFKVGQGSTLVLNGPISGNGNIILTNNGVLMLNGTNTYSSNTIVYSGTLILTNASALPTNTILAVSNLSSSFGNAGVSFGGDVVFPSSAVMRVSSQNGANGGIVTLGGNGTWNGPIFMQGANTFNIDGGMTLLDLAGPLITTNVSGGTVAFHYWNTRVRGALNIPSTAVTIGVGDGLSRGFDEQFTTVTFGSSNRWTTTTIDRGRVNLGTNNAIPITSAIRVGTLSLGVSDRRIIFDLAGYNQVISNINETAIGDSLVLIGNSSESSDSLLTVTSAITNNWAIRIVDEIDSPATPHKTALTVTSGTLNLIGTNTYTGPTTITGGRLNLVQGSGITAGFVGQLGTSPVTVSGTGILGGNGLVQDVINVAAGGTLAPGVSIGTLTATSTLNLGAGSKCEFEVNLGAGTNDQVVGLSSVTYGGTLVITNVGTQPFTNGTVLQLFSAASYTAGAVSIQPASPGPALAWDTSSLAVDGTLKVVPGAPLISGIMVLPTGNFSFTLTGTAGQSYSVLASTNVALPLASWQVLTSGILPASSYVFQDLTATNYPVRFYRTSNP